MTEADWTYPIHPHRTADMSHDIALDIPDAAVSELLAAARSEIEAQAPVSYGAPLGTAFGPIDWNQVKERAKQFSPFVIAILKIAFPQYPIDQILELLTKKIDAHQPTTPGLI